MNCLSQIELEKTLCEHEDGIPEPWDQHLASCESCRTRLEEYAGSKDQWDTACRALAECSIDTRIGDEKVDASTDGYDASNYRSTIFYRLDWQAGKRESTEKSDEINPGNESLAEAHSGIDLDAPSHPENLGRVGRYEVERSIGRGGMGIVFRGFDSELNRPVAIKILSPHLAGHGTARQRFTREAKAAAAVVHDNVVPIFDIHSETQQPYLVMPYVNGVSLQDYVDRKGQLGTRNILQVALQIASGLAAAHAQGLIHRDIKPANVLLENGLNRVQITDFGLARAVDDAAMTHSGMIAGTPHYMSPEQAKGESLDHRSDLFSLGCVMYFMATGRTLHRGEGPFSIISQLCQGKYIPVREINSKIPAYVADIIDKLLEQHPQHRFQSATQLAQYLEKSLAYLQQPTQQPVPRTIWSSQKKKVWRRRGVVAGSALLAVVLLIFGLPLLQPGSPNANNSSDHSLKGIAPGTIMLVPLADVDRDLDSIERSLSDLESQLFADPMTVSFDKESTSDPNGYQGENLQVELWELERQLNSSGSLEESNPGHSGLNGSSSSSSSGQSSAAYQNSFQSFGKSPSNKPQGSFGASQLSNPKSEHSIEQKKFNKYGSALIPLQKSQERNKD